MGVARSLASTPARKASAMPRMQRLNLSLLAKFSLVSLVVMAVIALTLGWGIQRQLEQNALQQAAEGAADHVSTVLDPHLEAGDLAGGLDPDRYAQIDGLIQSHVDFQHIARIKIWNRDGRVVFSDEKDLVGRRFTVSHELQEALDGEIATEVSSWRKEAEKHEDLFQAIDGEIATEVSSVLPDEHVAERTGDARLLEVYVPLHPQGSTQVEGAYELYYDLARVEPHIAAMQRFVWSSVGLGFGLLYGALFTLVRNASGELVRRNDENARLYAQAKQRLLERERAEQAQRESDERLRAFASALPDLAFVIDEHGRYVEVLATQGQLLSAEAANLKNRRFHEVLPKKVADLYLGVVQRTIGTSKPQTLEYLLDGVDGERWVEARTAPMQGAHNGSRLAVWIARDITDRKTAEQQLLHNAFHDVLTDLPNRALFLDRLRGALERKKRSKDYQYAVLFLDIDRFKVINDSLGHSLGDELLVAIARRLLVCLRSADTVARLGGDEFVILLEDAGNGEAVRQVAGRLLDELKLPFVLSGHKVFIAASMGIVLGSLRYDSPEAVLRDADITMYRAKARGKGRYELVQSGMLDQAKAVLYLEHELHRALEQGEFRLHYQPIVSLETSGIIGFEALVRWQHPEHGLIAPAEFIPLAEETGLIVPLGEWVLAEACRQMKAWQDQFPTDPLLTISVNLSGRQFAHPGLIAQVRKVLQATGLDAQSLRMEITESVFMEDTRATVETLTKLRDLGVRLQIDDFGTGYSSLGYLQQFPIDTIKIDRSFIRKMGGVDNGSEIVRTIILLARQLGLDTVAEGVETTEQMAYLKTLQCRYGQGYLVSKPLQREAVEELLLEL